MSALNINLISRNTIYTGSSTQDSRSRKRHRYSASFDDASAEPSPSPTRAIYKQDSSAVCGAHAFPAKTTPTSASALFYRPTDLPAAKKRRISITEPRLLPSFGELVRDLEVPSPIPHARCTAPSLAPKPNDLLLGYQREEIVSEWDVSTTQLWLLCRGAQFLGRSIDARTLARWALAFQYHKIDGKKLISLTTRGMTQLGLLNAALSSQGERIRFLSLYRELLCRFPRRE